MLTIISGAGIGADMEKETVKGFPNVECHKTCFSTGSSYRTRRAKKVGYIEICDFESHDNWTYHFYDKRTGENLGSINVEVPHKDGYYQDPPSATKPFKTLMRQLNRNAERLNYATT